MKHLLSFLSFLILTGCATGPTADELANIDYGPAITIDYEQAIKNYFEERLFDPFSAQYKFTDLGQYWSKDAPLMGGKLHAGWGIEVKINAKNKFGAYTGFKTYRFIFKNNSIIEILTPEDIALMGS